MKIVLVRHGQANPEVLDPARSLSEEGRNQAGRAGRFLRALELRPDAVLSSDKARAVETARVICDILEYPASDVLSSRVFAPNGDPEEMAGEIDAVGGETVILVGHMPSIAGLASYLITTPAEGYSRIAFDTCQVALLTGERPVRAGKFTLELSFPAGTLMQE
ncbi:MAG: phosphohistidine phosphatase SixA [Deltaproteobacteria bacterium]|nr:MAG: phosphohistidine phosphatase SixA [Deltaproteobacteria bacterium]